MRILFLCPGNRVNLEHQLVVTSFYPSQILTRILIFTLFFIKFE